MEQLAGVNLLGCRFVVADARGVAAKISESVRLERKDGESRCLLSEVDPQHYDRMPLEKKSKLYQKNSEKLASVVARIVMK